jgi:hypothetical protein
MAIIAEGHYDYMSGLTDCLDDMMGHSTTTDMYTADYSTGWTSSIPTFITGHSLGGAAATLFAKSKSCWQTGGTSSAVGCPTTADNRYPRLVTFGAAPTSYMGASVAQGQEIECMDEGLSFTGGDSDAYMLETGKYCSGGIMTKSGFSDYLDCMDGNCATAGSISGYCSGANPQGLRYAHKFDPIPSIATWAGKYGHAVENLIMVWDVYESTCASSSTSCPLSSGTLKSGKTAADLELGFYGNSDAYAIKDYLCAEYGIQAVAVPTGCVDKYSSYASLANPFPCGQILFMERFKDFMEKELPQGVSEIFGEVDSDVNYEKMTNWFGNGEGAIAIGDFVYDFHTLTTTLFKEMETFAVCVSDWLATVDAYMLSSVVDHWMQLGFLFTFTYVHSTYGLYPLCAEVDSSGMLLGDIGGETMTDLKPTTSGCTTSEMNAIYAYCSRVGYKESPYCVDDGVWNSCTPLCDPTYEPLQSYADPDTTGYKIIGASCAYGFGSGSGSGI